MITVYLFIIGDSENPYSLEWPVVPNEQEIITFRPNYDNEDPKNYIIVKKRWRIINRELVVDLNLELLN